MQASEEKDDSPLLDADISRLIKLSREVGYKKQDDIPQRNLVDFKPLSIDKIVAEVESKPSKPDASNKVEDREKPTHSKLETKDNNTQDQKEDNQTDIGLDDKIEEKQKQVIAERVEENPSDKIIEPPEEEVPNFDDKEALKQNVITPSNNDEAIEAARKEGIEIGKKMAFSEIETDQTKSVETLNLLIKNIKNKETIDKSELMSSITNVIITLASERAGLEIDKTPEILKKKILAFVDEIEHASKKVVVNLNPNDAELIKEISKEPFFTENIELKENSELFRGDFILQMGTIEMGNLISKQLFISEPEIEDATNSHLEQDDGRPKEDTKDLNELGDAPLNKAEDQKRVEENGK